MSKKRCPKYLYHVFTWGGFYNREYVEMHHLTEGDFFFETPEKRAACIAGRKLIAASLYLENYICFSCTEGYHCKEHTILHRVVSYKDKQYYSEHDLGVGCSYASALHFLQNEWYPGFNDYPLGEPFDYDKVHIDEEWITGAFTVDHEQN